LSPIVGQISAGLGLGGAVVQLRVQRNLKNADLFRAVCGSLLPERPSLSSPESSLTRQACSPREPSLVDVRVDPVDDVFPERPGRTGRAWARSVVSADAGTA
jgi:hypothetical protein